MQRASTAASLGRLTLCLALAVCMISIGAATAWAQSWLGVQIQPVPTDVAHRYGLPAGVGALVVNVVAGSPAHLSGMQAGDVVVRINRVTLEGPQHLALTVSSLPPAQSVVVDLLRGGAPMSGQVALAQAPSGLPPVAAAPSVPSPAAPSSSAVPYQKQWYESDTMGDQMALIERLKRNGLLEDSTGPSIKPPSVALGEQVWQDMQKGDALTQACERHEPGACEALEQHRVFEQKRLDAMCQATGMMAAENQRLEFSNRQRRESLSRQYRDQSIRLRGEADLYDQAARDAFAKDDFAAGRRYTDEAKRLRGQADDLAVGTQ